MSVNFTKVLITLEVLMKEEEKEEETLLQKI